MNSALYLDKGRCGSNRFKRQNIPSRAFATLSKINLNHQ